jgi:hypothetical protein
MKFSVVFGLIQVQEVSNRDIVETVLNLVREKASTARPGSRACSAGFSDPPLRGEAGVQTEWEEESKRERVSEQERQRGERERRERERRERGESERERERREKRKRARVSEQEREERESERVSEQESLLARPPSGLRWERARAVALVEGGAPRRWPRQE